MLEPPIERILRRPNFSTTKKDTGVEHTFTSVVINTVEGIFGSAKPREEDCSKVENKANSGQLLHHLH